MNNAFLVRLSMTTWTARKMDKGATRQAKDHAGATDKAGVKVYKTVIAAEELDAIQSICNAARIEHRKRTVPWSYDGPGAITAEGYPAYKAAMTGYEREFNLAVARFNEVYAAEREKAREYLGNLFDPADYPDSMSLGSKFSFSVSAEPMPEANNFRVNLPPEIVAEIKKDIVLNNQQAFENANNAAWARVIEKVEKLKLAMANYKPGEQKGKFHDTVVSNIVELAELIPSINISNDEDLTRMQRKLLSLTAYTAQDLREDENLREEVAKACGAILADITVKARAA